MDKKLKAKWVKALRSGKYKQGQCSLYKKKEKAYCCLGVLGRVMGKTAASLGNAKNEPASGMTPKSWRVIDPDRVDALISMNDHQSRPFGEIADYIEANL